MPENGRSMEVTALLLEKLVRGIGHDMGAPSRHITHFSERLLEQLSNDLSDNQLEYLQFINQSGEQLQRMINGLNQLTKLSTPKQVPNQLNLETIFRQQLEFHQTCTASPLTISEIKEPTCWPSVSGYEIHWQTLFSALLENAFKFHSTKLGHTIEIVTEFEISDTDFTFTIEDNGIGIRDSQFSDLGRAFKQFNNCGDYPGEGLGLYFCQLIAELNQATLSFSRSQLGGLKACYQQNI